MLPAQQARPRVRRWHRLVRLLPLLAALVPFSCGRVGYSLLELPNDAPGNGGSASARDSGTSRNDATTSDSGGTTGSGGSGASGAGGVNGSGGRSGTSPDRDASLSSDAGGRSGETDAASNATDSGDAALSPYPSCSATKQWALSFDSDPTAYDGDHDGVFDWIVRDGSPFPVSSLVGGVWQSSDGTTLDSRPKENFDARTIIDVRLRSLTVPTSHYGAVAWINVNEDKAAFSALFASVVLQAGGGQELTVFGKDGNTETPIATFPNLPEDFVELHLDIDPVALTVSVWVDGTFQNTYPFFVTGAPNGDAFVTLLSWEGTSEFDFVTVMQCTP